MTRHLLVPGYLLLCLVMGGASAAGFSANFALQLMALPLIGWALWHLAMTGVPLLARVPLSLLGSLIGIALLQLIPLPPSVWTNLPGRGPVAAGFGLLGMPLPWLPITLAPEAALASLLWLLPAFGALLAMLALGAFRGRRIAAVIIIVTMVSVVLGALQVIGGGSYLYRITNPTVAVGFFANANHNATLMLVCIPFLAALTAVLVRQARSARGSAPVRILAWAGFAVILVGLFINASLAGIGLGLPVALASWIVFGKLQPRIRRVVVLITVLLSIVVVLVIAIGPFGNNLFGAQQANVELSRQTSFALTFRAATQYFPFGSGVGTFQPIYRTYEPLATVGRTFMNHAHSDWLELLLETGVVGVIYIALFLVWWAGRVRTIWRAQESDPFAKAAVIASLTIMVHSTVDYPLRTAAISTVFAVCLGLMTGVRPYVRRSREASTARHLSI